MQCSNPHLYRNSSEETVVYNFGFFTSGFSPVDEMAEQRLQAKGIAHKVEAKSWGKQFLTNSLSWCEPLMNASFLHFSFIFNSGDLFAIFLQCHKARI